MIPGTRIPIRTVSIRAHPKAYIPIAEALFLCMLLSNPSRLGVRDA